VELYTESWANAYGTADEAAVLSTFQAAARAAGQAGLGVNAGHDLNLHNLRAFAVAIPALDEVSIGHALIADALELGMAGAVQAYLNCLKEL
jgi:pyridoxine 5-phosphate synthase